MPQCGVVEPVGGGQHFAHPGAQVDWQVPSVVLMYKLQHSLSSPFRGAKPSGAHPQLSLSPFLRVWPEQQYLQSLLLPRVSRVCFRHRLPRRRQRLASTSAAGRPIATRPPTAPRAPSTRRRSPISPSRWEMASNRFGSTLDLSAHVTRRRRPPCRHRHTLPLQPGGPPVVQESASHRSGISNERNTQRPGIHCPFVLARYAETRSDSLMARAKNAMGGNR